MRASRFQPIHSQLVYVPTFLVRLAILCESVREGRGLGGQRWLAVGAVRACPAMEIDPCRSAKPLRDAKNTTTRVRLCGVCETFDARIETRVVAMS